MHPAQTLDLQADMLARCTDSRFRDIFISHYSSDMTANGILSQREAEEQGMRLSALMYHGLRLSSAYYVSPEMTDLITWSAAALDSTDVFRYDELPTEAGFAYFEKPLILTDVRGRDLYVNVLLWFTTTLTDKRDGRERPGTTMVLFNDHDATPDVIAHLIMDSQHGVPYERYRDAMGRWGLIGVDHLWTSMRIGPEKGQASEAKMKQIEMEGLDPIEVTNFPRLAHAFWIMLNQTVVDVTKDASPRPFAKRAKRMGIPDRVSVVRLRHVTGRSGVGESSVEWQHRWLVRGHWAWRHCSEHHPLAEPDGRGGFHARVWVRGHVRGPEDKPLLITNKVYHLAR